ncbi:MAG: 5-bromo-4-chloroindolyl phosphate hydrolysis family protein [Eubacteriales bacterium]|nr:5-bromo-4-chloroindolyl phosphate hydrolysis family protein [Eubacteriales bacterium]
MDKKRIPSAIPIYGAAAVWLVMGLILPIYRLWAIFLTLALSAVSALALKKKFPGREVEVVRRADTGDETVNWQIEEGRETLRRIHASNEAIPDPELSEEIRRMEAAGGAIFDALEKDVTKASQVRRFMTYYLPTTDKLLSRYRELQNVASGGENVNRAMDSIRRSMGMVATAFEKQLDALYKDSALDIETDIEVLETMLSTEQGSGNMPMGGV